MSSVVNVLSWAAIVCAAAAIVLSLVPLATGRRASHRAPGTSWQTIRSSVGVILLVSARWADGVAVWLLLAVGVWLVVGWNLASWLRMRYRLSRTG